MFSTVLAVLYNTYINEQNILVQGLFFFILSHFQFISLFWVTSKLSFINVHFSKSVSIQPTSNCTVYISQTEWHIPTKTLIDFRILPKIQHILYSMPSFMCGSLNQSWQNGIWQNSAWRILQYLFADCQCFISIWELLGCKLGCLGVLDLSTVDTLSNLPKWGFPVSFQSGPPGDSLFCFLFFFLRLRSLNCIAGLEVISSLFSHWFQSVFTVFLNLIHLYY